MLNDGTGFKKVYIATGFTDLRRGIDGLARTIRFQFQLDPYNRNTLFLFCGKRTDRIKGLLWEGDGFLLLYKRIESCTHRICYPIIIAVLFFVLMLILLNDRFDLP